MRHFIPLLLASVCLIPSAWAADAVPAPVTTEPLTAKPEEAPAAKPDLPTYSPILPVKIKPRQGGADEMSKAAANIQQENNIDPDSLGLLTKASDGAFSPELWKGYTGETLSKDLATFNHDIASPTMRDLLRRALLTVPDAASFADDQEDKEAFSARLNAITEIGAFDQSVALYKKLEGDIPSGLAAYAGVQAIVGKGQMGLACLEEKAVNDTFKSQAGVEFWSDLRFLCNDIVSSSQATAEGIAPVAIVRSTAEMQKFPPVAKLSDLNEKSIVHAYSLARSKDMPSSLFTLEETEKLHPKYLNLLLDRNDATLIPVLTAAVNKGMRPVEDLIVAYKTLSGVAAPGLPPLILTYGKVQAAANDTTRAPLLKETLKLSANNTALLPFASAFAAMKDVDSFTPAEARRVISLLIRSDKVVTGPWAAKAFDKAEWRSAESVTESDLILALKNPSTPTPTESKGTEDKKSDKALKKQTDERETLEKAQLDALLLIFAPQEVEDKTPEKSYEKLFSLTPPTNYVMPSMELMNNLSMAANRQDTGKVILYSLQALDGHRVSQTHPSAFYRITEGLKSVGLSEEIRSLAHEVLADLIEKEV